MIKIYGLKWGWIDVLIVSFLLDWEGDNSTKQGVDNIYFFEEMIAIWNTYWVF